MKRFLLFSFTSVSVYVLLAGCSSSGGGGAGAPPCDDAGTCANPALVCQGGFCVQPPSTGGSGGGSQGGTGNVGTGGIPSGGTGNVGTGGGPSGGSGGLPSGGTGGIPSGGAGGFGGGTGGSSNCGDFDIGEPVCQGCLETNCCAEMFQCATGTPCDDLNQCVAQFCAEAPDLPTCVQESCSQFIGGAQAHDDLATCINGSCASACGL